MKLRISSTLHLEGVEREVEGLVAERGRPAKLIRRRVGLLLLEEIANLSDEGVCEA